MDILSGVTGLLGGIGGLVQGGLQLAWDKKVQERNWRSEKEQQEYDRALQKTMFAREDSAYQRKSADLEKAGFNKLLAVGGAGASAGPVVKSEAPKLDRVGVPDFAGKISDSVMDAINLMRQQVDISKVDAEKRAISAQIDKIDAERMDIEASTRMKNFENKYWIEDAKMPPNAATIQKEVGGIRALFEEAASKLSRKTGADGLPVPAGFPYLEGESLKSYSRRKQIYLNK